VKAARDRKTDSGFAARPRHHRDLAFHLRRYYRRVKRSASQR
jgi:hypothetical protein